MAPNETQPKASIPSDEFTVLSIADYCIRKNLVHDTSIVYLPNWSNRISGHIEGPRSEIEIIFRFLELNDPIPVRDFIESIKKVRTEIFRAKQLHEAQRGVR